MGKTQGGPAIPVAISENNVAQSVLLTDASGNVADVGLGGYLVVAASEHHEIHKGEFFMASFVTDHDTGDIADDDNLDILIVVGAEALHMEWKVNHDGDVEILFYEGATVGANGNALPIRNRKRSSANTSDVEVYEGPTVTTTGTILSHLFEPGGSGPNALGSKARAGVEWLLASNTTYLLRTINRSNSAMQVGVALDWYK